MAEINYVRVIIQVKESGSKMCIRDSFIVRKLHAGVNQGGRRCPDRKHRQGTDQPEQIQ